MQGDQNALAAYAGFDPAAAFQMQAGQQRLDLDRRSTEQSIAASKAVMGIDARISTNTQARALNSLPSTIASDEIGVTARRSRVWCSRSLLIAPAVAAGASTATIRVCSVRSPRKIPRPMLAEAYVATPPNDEEFRRTPPGVAGASRRRLRGGARGW